MSNTTKHRSKTSLLQQAWQQLARVASISLIIAALLSGLMLLPTDDGLQPDELRSDVQAQYLQAGVLCSMGNNNACEDDLKEVSDALQRYTKTAQGTDPLSKSDIDFLKSYQDTVREKISILETELRNDSSCDADCERQGALLIQARSALEQSEAVISRATTAAASTSTPAPATVTPSQPAEPELAAPVIQAAPPKTYTPADKTSVTTPAQPAGPTVAEQAALKSAQDVAKAYTDKVASLMTSAQTYYDYNKNTSRQTLAELKTVFTQELAALATERQAALGAYAAISKPAPISQQADLAKIEQELRDAETARKAAFEKVQQADAYRAERKVEDVLGRGFGDKAGGITRYSETTRNALVDERGGTFAEAGIGEVNAIFYNIKDFLKYFAAALAILWLTISAFRLVTAQDDERIQGAKKGIEWALIGLILVFVADLAVVAFFEGGQLNTPGQSLVGIEHTLEDGKTVINYDLTDENNLTKNLMASIADYFTKDVRAFFEFLKVLGSAISILMIFMIGFWLVNAAGNEEAIEAGKKYLMHVLTAFVVLLMLDALIFQGLYPENVINIAVTDELGEISYVAATVTQPECLEYLRTATKDNLTLAPTYEYLNADGETQTGRCTSAAEIGKVASEDYILGVVRFFQTLIGAIAVFFLVYSAIQIIGSFGNEEAIEQHKKQVLWSMAGLGVIVLSETVVKKFFFITDYNTGGISVNASQGIADIAGITNFVATFVGVFSFMGILIAGIMWVANFGNQEISDKAKKIIISSIIGIIISVSAFAVVNSITKGRSNPSDGIQFDAQIGK